MKPEIAKRWADALRDPKYKQGTGRLRRGDRFCCLGVLCDISGLDIWKDHDFLIDEIGGPGCVYLPRLIMEWSGIRTCHGECGLTSLSKLNDTGKTFAEIADIIEAHVDEL